MSVNLIQWMVFFLHSVECATDVTTFVCCDQKLNL